MKTRNPLSAWISEFIRHNPEATPAQGWHHLTAISAQYGVLLWLIGKDASGDLLYQPDPYQPPRRIKHLSFCRQFQRARVLAGFA